MAKKHSDKLLALLKAECEKIPKRVPGYHDELLLAIADIVRAEREHMQRSSDIQKQVSAYCERLGDSISGPQVAPKKVK